MGLVFLGYLVGDLGGVGSGFWVLLLYFGVALDGILV